jgi:ketopantoate reductase
VFARIQKDELNELVCTILEEYEEILDIENESTKQLSDDEIKNFLLQSQGITNPLMIQSLEKVRRNEILITAKAMGAGLRQLSRLTGVSFGVIQKL